LDATLSKNTEISQRVSGDMYKETYSKVPIQPRHEVSAHRGAGKGTSENNEPRAHHNSQSENLVECN